MRKKIPLIKSIQFRLTILIALVSLVTGIVMIFFLSNVYQSRIDREYKNRAVYLAKIAASLLQAHDMDRYLSTLETDDEYDRLLDILRLKQVETGVEYITVSRIFRGGETFIFDTDSDEDSRVYLGDTVFWTEEENFYAIEDILLGNPVDTYTQRTRWGWLLIALEPIFREDGTVAAHAAVSISMNEILQERRNGFILLGTIVGIIFLFSIAVNMFFIRRFVISPVKLLEERVYECLPSENQNPAYKPREPILFNGDELELLERALIEMETRIFISMGRERRASSVKNAFLANMSHELRTPMNSAINMIKEAMHGIDNSQSLSALGKAIASSEDLLSVLNTILEISNIESGELVLSNDAFKVNEIVSDINNLISSLCSAKNIVWEPHVNIPEGLSVECDKIRLMQVLTIILRNAVKYADEQEGKVLFEINTSEETGESICLNFNVKDNGIGMTEKKLTELKSMFAPDSNFIDYGSSEIMLSACSSIIKSMGSVINVKSEPGNGSCFNFSLTLPKVYIDEKAEEIELESLDFTGKKVLVADDVAVNRAVLSFILEQTGMEIIEAKDGKEALDIYLSDPNGIDLIFMDIMMPNMDGYEASREIRASDAPNAETLPIVAVTSLTYKEDVDAAFNAGMNFHLEKPVEPEKLLSCLVRFL